MSPLKKTLLSCAEFWQGSSTPASPWRSIPTTYRVEELPRSASRCVSRSGFPKKNLGFPKKMGERIWCFWFLMVFPGILVGLFLANFFLEEGGREGKSIVKCKDFGVGKWNLWGIHWYIIQNHTIELWLTSTIRCEQEILRIVLQSPTRSVELLAD